VQVRERDGLRLTGSISCV
jgi:glycogen synthase kinase 3 beta